LPLKSRGVGNLNVIARVIGMNIDSGFHFCYNNFYMNILGGRVHHERKI